VISITDFCVFVPWGHFVRHPSEISLSDTPHSNTRSKLGSRNGFLFSESLFSSIRSMCEPLKFGDICSIHLQLDLDFVTDSDVFGSLFVNQFSRWTSKFLSETKHHTLWFDIVLPLSKKASDPTTLTRNGEHSIFIYLYNDSTSRPNNRTISDFYLPVPPNYPLNKVPWRSYYCFYRSECLF